MQLSQQENSNVKGEQFNKIDPIGFGCRSRPCDTVSACMMLGSAIPMADELRYIIDSKLRMMKVPWGLFERELSCITLDSLRGSGAVRLACDIEDAETRRGVSILIQRGHTTQLHMDRVDVVGIVALSCNTQAWTSVCVLVF